MKATAKVEPAEVEIQAFGVPGTAGKLAAPLNPPPQLRWQQQAFWLASPPRERDLHAGFVADFRLAESCRLNMKIITPCAFRLWFDGSEIVTGPLRFAPSVPEFQDCHYTAGAGFHRICLHVHHEGLTTRLSAKMPPFVWVDVAKGDTRPLRWWGRPLDEYLDSGLRVSPLQGWVEWIGHPRPESWLKEKTSKKNGWRRVAAAAGLDQILGPAIRSDLQLPGWPELALSSHAEGRFREVFTGYRFDDIAVQFLTAYDNPPGGEDDDGSWHRYDLDRVRIGSLELDIASDAPGLATVAYAERLDCNGRPLPVIPNSAGPTRMLQKFAFGPGTTRVRPLQALGARHLEVRLATRGRSAITRAVFRERDTLGPPTGALSLDDPLLERVWRVGLDTMRSSAEDSVVDSVRERGEWLGDLSSVGCELAAVGWGSTTHLRRALLHAAAGARADGLVAGCGPGELLYLGTFAAQWILGCVRCAELEGSTAVLDQLEQPASRNMQALLDCLEPDLRSHRLPWPFVDWGYKARDGRMDLPALLHLLAALRAMLRWKALLGRPPEAAWQRQEKRITAALRQALRGRTLAYHEAVLAERVGLVNSCAAAKTALRHLKACFPFDARAPRLRDPTVASAAVATPYFTHFSIDVIIRAGRTDAALDLWRHGWGWMLSQGATTWWEVFDDRWSRCHYWSGSPTWQMTRRLLGISPVLRDGRAAVEFEVYPGSLQRASGAVPAPGVGLMHVQWVRQDDRRLKMQIDSPKPWRLAIGREVKPQGAGRTSLELALTSSETSFRVGG